MRREEMCLALVGSVLVACCVSLQAAVRGLDVLPTPKVMTVEGGEMALTAKSRIVAADPSLEPLAAILSDEILLTTGLKLAPATGDGRPGDVVLKLDPTIRADADIIAVQMKDGRQQVVRTRDFAHAIVVSDTALVTG